MGSPLAFSAAGGGVSRAGGGMRPKLEHAYLELRTPPPRGSLTPGGPCGRIDFQFNPKELSLAKGAIWKRTPAKGAKSAGPPEYQGPEPSRLTLEMFFDASDTQDSSVVVAVEKLLACCVPTSETRQQQRSSPPWVVFHWGGLTGFPGYVSKVSVKYTLFTTSGVPVRAVCQVTVEEITGETPGQNPTSGALHARRVHRLRAGETLAHLAWQEYGDPGAWRAIAEANGIDDPMRLAPGRELLLPALGELAGEPRGEWGGEPGGEPEGQGRGVGSGAGRPALASRPGLPAGGSRGRAW
ncbi:LysM peptidoglycan-binding domain-containing protein [Streptomyces hoynatensis]|uniref:LysM domain-containing protein n=1 Tax=Streptomyces hoynatensis TaxID=1141874 RepID=A0A3A9YF57_9ACTN|nr:LysM peptidoglycan-binding domain-containing protein [Streptomyces hoynatensis]RKN35802.1 LysM domain-containing protein [Streptomyces hoynatensis]